MKKEILAILEKEGALSERKIKKLLSKQKAYNGDKFVKTMESLQSKGKITLSNEKYSLTNYGKRKRSNSEDIIVQPAKQSKTTDTENSVYTTNNSDKPDMSQLWKDGERYWRENLFDVDYLNTNPNKITRLFCGNLNKKVTEDDLKGCIEGITYIKWITDKQTGEFYGSSFIEVASAEYAIKAVAKDKSKFMGRPLKIYYCPPRPGDIWPPPPGSQGGATSSHRNPPKKEKTPRPPGCKKLFAGNLSYNIDDDTMVEFFKDCGDMVGLRWLVHQDSGEFRGSGYVEFSKPEEAEEAMKLDGKELLGRPIRLDWTT